MEKTKLSFEVDASQIDIKPILRKDFLELSMKAISSANPNRNNSWFTEESMERSKDTFVNKPILGYFENDDFVSHNGDWSYDSETEMDYWDTLGKKGERILGTIRESDEIKIIKDKKGLSWITFTCMLWTQYSFKQVKRLIKDAKRAAKEGIAAKNISVEVDITDYEMLPNGVMKINQFNLVGVTILGSRNGVKVEPGIEDAELSVVDIMGRDVYEKQQQALRLAYERLDDSGKNKGEFQMEKEEILKTPESSNEVESSKEPVAEHKEFEGEVCPDCGKNPCECENKHCEEEPKEEEKPEEEKKENEEEKPAQCEEEFKEVEPEKPECCEKEEPKEEEKPEEDRKEDECGHCEKSEWEIKYEELEKQYNELKCAHEELEKKFEEKCADCEKYADYEDIKTKLSSYEHKEFMEQANNLIASAKLDEKVSAQFCKDCEEGVIANIADLKVKVAVAAFDLNTKVEETNTLTVPVSNPDTTTAFASKAEKSSKHVDCWSRLHEYSGK